MNLSRFNMKMLSAMAGVSMLALSGNSAVAADLGGDCCADLEERVAVLEATTARKGNRKVSLTISGHVNEAILFWDDGIEDDAYVVGNANDDLAMFRFEGEAKIAPGWSAGYLVEIELNNASSDTVTAVNDDGEPGLGLSDVHMYIESEQFGRVSLGFTGQPSDGAPEMDVSGTGFIGYASIADVAGGFDWRLTGGGFSGVTLGAVFDDLNGDTFDIVRYDTPTIMGFTLSASWGEDDLWDVALAYENEIGDFEVAAAIAYSDNTDEGVDLQTVAGSVSIIHNPTGLNLTFATGTRDYNTMGQSDSDFYYVKGGLYKRFNTLGKTAFYGEYGQFNDMFFNDPTNGGAAAVSTALTGGATDIITGSEAKVWGLGVVQYIDAAAMSVFAGYRHYEVDFDATTAGGVATAVNALEDFDTVMVGARIEF